MVVYNPATPEDAEKISSLVRAKVEVERIDHQ